MKKIGSNATYPEYLEEISEDASYYKEQGDWVIDGRPDVLAHWKTHGSWQTPPILINRKILSGKDGAPHLIEGHTRVGCLLGVNKYKIIKIAKTHKAYWGTYTK